MTPEQFKGLLQSQRKELKQAFARTLPVKIGTAAQNFACDNFRRQGFLDGSLQAWTPSKRRSDPKNPDRAYGTLLSRRRALYMSIKHRVQPGVAIVYSNVPYAAAHNEGTSNAGRGHRTRLPKRQFLGASKTFAAQAMQIIDKEISRILKTN